MTKYLFIVLQLIIPKQIITKLAGKLALTKKKWLKNWLITKFCTHFKVNLNEAKITNINDFSNFNEFFTRELQPKTRPIATASNAIVSPVDGSISQLGVINGTKIIQVKGRDYSLQQLLDFDDNIINTYKNGIFNVIYLSPKDYHRIHLPIAAVLKSSTYIPGSFYSVNKTTVERVPRLFARNERLICNFNNKNIGDFCLIMVGALIVSGIETIWYGKYGHHNKTITNKYKLSYAKGEEIGRFNVGSTVILLFANNQALWQPNLNADTTLKMGEMIATAPSSL